MKSWHRAIGLGSIFLFTAIYPVWRAFRAKPVTHPEAAVIQRESTRAAWAAFKNLDTGDPVKNAQIRSLGQPIRFNFELRHVERDRASATVSLYYESNGSFFPLDAHIYIEIDLQRKAGHWKANPMACVQPFDLLAHPTYSSTTDKDGKLLNNLVKTEYPGDGKAPGEPDAQPRLATTGLVYRGIGRSCCRIRGVPPTRLCLWEVFTRTGGLEHLALYRALFRGANHDHVHRLHKAPKIEEITC